MSLTCPPIQYHIESFTGYRDPGKGKVITDCVINTTPVAFIFTRYCLFLMFYRFMQTVENLLSKMYSEGALMSKSGNIALTQSIYYIHESPGFKTTCM